MQTQLAQRERELAEAQAGGDGPGGEAIERALKTLSLAERVLEQLEEAQEWVVETYGEDADALGEGGAKLGRVLAVVQQILRGEEP
jgi:hypothetical protein